MTTSTVTRTRGDDWEIVGPIENGGAPVDLTGASFASQLRPEPDSTELTATFTVSVVGDPTDGIVKLALARATTVNINPAPNPKGYAYDIEVTNAANKKTTYGGGNRLIVKADSTHD